MNEIITSALRAENVDEEIIEMILDDQRIFNDYDLDDDYDQTIINNKISAIIEIISYFNNFEKSDNNDYTLMLKKISRLMKSKY